MQKIKLKIEDLGMNGEGVAHFEGKTLFVPFALKNEIVTVEVAKQKGDILFCKVIQVENQSNDRVNAKCPYFGECGGCDLQHINYEKQLEFKTLLIKNTIKKIAGINVNVQPCKKSEIEFCYRNKIVFVVKNNKIGLLKKETHDLVEIEHCVITENFNKRLMLVLKEFMKTNPNNNIQHFVARFINNALLLTIVSKTPKINGQNCLVKLIKQNFPNFGLNLNINSKSDGEILSGNFVHIAGMEKIKTEENGVYFNVDSGSFFQVNENVRIRLYDFVLKNLKGQICLDAFSGAGLLSALISKFTKKVFAVEINKRACDDANELLLLNNIKNVNVICGDCTEIIPQVLKYNKIDCVVLDPPRSGCTNKILQTLKNSDINNIVYVSCSPQTLARDLKTLSDKYMVKEVQPFDMFPQTKHVETVAVLIRI